MVTALLQMYKEGGWLPKWPNPGYTGIMIGSHSDAIIADAWVKGIRNFDLQLAYEACRKNAFVPQQGDETNRWRDRQKNTQFPETRGGLTWYLQNGWVACDKAYEATSRTLEFAYNDFCVAQLAKAAGKEDDYAILMKRSQNYKNLWHDGFMNPRNLNGTWADIDKVYSFTEGGKWTYLFCVMQDIPGLIELMGGKEAFAAKLDENFEKKHYRHDNEPGHHYPYLYNYCDQPWKTQKLVREIMREHYKNKPDGYSGNDDCGQMSAWYVLSSLGFYSVTPGSDIYALGSPLWKKATLHIGEPYAKAVFTIIANNQSPENVYVQSVNLNGKPLLTPFIRHSEIVAGGTLEFDMGPNPKR
jgi:predicted alpha-1,2-mannosidase